ncbi:MAG: DUF3995 domain-containing protein [Chloroflexi bacterium]|nr:DUF3995 domain-containing protein [Chloroflexota bacterium]
MPRWPDRATLSRWAGWAVAMALTVFLGLNAYWGLGGEWGLAEVMGAPGALPPVWVVWVQAAMVAAAIVAVLGRSAILHLPIPRRVLNGGVWLLAGILAMVAMGNFASPPGWAKYVLGPVALVLAGLTALVASSSTTPPSDTD